MFGAVAVMKKSVNVILDKIGKETIHISISMGPTIMQARFFTFYFNVSDLLFQELSCFATKFTKFRI